MINADARARRMRRARGRGSDRDGTAAGSSLCGLSQQEDRGDGDHRVEVSVEQGAEQAEQGELRGIAEQEQDQRRLAAAHDPRAPTPGCRDR